MLDFKPVSQEEKDKALNDLFKNEVTSAPFLSTEIFLGESIKEDIVEYMISRIKSHYNVASTNEALSLWGRYRDEVLDNEQ